MRLKNLYAVILCGALAATCSNDSDIKSISGTWLLTNTSTAAGVNTDYEKGDVTWSFNERNHILTVQNKIAPLLPESITAGLATGNYTFYIKQEQDIQQLYIDGVRAGALANTGNNLVISSDFSERNGQVKVFTR